MAHASTFFGYHSDCRLNLLSHVCRYDTLWDPKLADEAERRGEDIQGFLSGEHELVKKQCLMALLHMFGYSVSCATREYKRIEQFAGGISSKLNPWEAIKVEKLLQQGKKDFQLLSKKTKRSPLDCMIHYYNWKATNDRYGKTKDEWRKYEMEEPKNDYCAVCDDGGNLIVCDGCDNSYHPECLSPPLTEIPDGKWFCPKCQRFRGENGHRGIMKNGILSSPPIMSPSLSRGSSKGHTKRERKTQQSCDELFRRATSHEPRCIHAAQIEANISSSPEIQLISATKTTIRSMSVSDSPTKPGPNVILTVPDATADQPHHSWYQDGKIGKELPITSSYSTTEENADAIYSDTLSEDDPDY